MTGAAVVCATDKRRDEVRRRERNGIDYVEVSDDQRRLTLYFLGAAPEGLTRDNVRITGGTRITGIEVVSVDVCPRRDPEIDNCMVVTVDRPGDFSTYTLCLVNLPEDAPFDPRYRCVDFSFKAACPTDLDCAAQPACPPETYPEPEISYLAKDYSSFRRLILDRLSVVMPDWQERHIPDVGITLIELLAYLGDQLSYYQDAVATEAYLNTARQRISVRRHARLVDYTLHEGCNARAFVHVKTSTDVTVPADQLSFITRFPQAPEVDGRVLRWDDLRDVSADRYLVFEPMGGGATPLEFRTAHNEIGIYTWGDRECCLRQGATSATLVDALAPAGPVATAVTHPERALHLKPSDILIFEEVIGPRTGDPDDADPTHRHAVRLTRVEPGVDELYDQPIVNVWWDREDALPFPLCVSTVGPAPECALIEGVSVARGNVLLVDHGRSSGEPEALGSVPIEATEVVCEGEGRASDVVYRPGRFQPTLATGPITFAVPLPASAPAATLLIQDPREAVPSLRLTSRVGEAGGDASNQESTSRDWVPRRDLLASSGDDAHFVVEMDDRRRAHLRFGDGELGRRPGAGAAFEARYRVGNGTAGNLGADSIALAVTRDLLDGVVLEPRNPLAARGGTAPESLAEARLFAPEAFRHELARAITADDYARIAERHPAVQRAAAELRWNGSWYEVRVAIDPLGTDVASPELLVEIERYLARFRRIGHDLAVRPAERVALDIAMKVCVEPTFLRGHVKAALIERFGTGRLADGTRGFFHPDELTFGTGISLSRLVAAAEGIAGVASVEVIRLERLFEGPNGEIENGVLPIGPLEIPRLDNDPSFPEHGRIRFDLRGGR